MSLKSLPIDYSDNESENEVDEFTFHNACSAGNLKVVKIYLVEQGFDMNSTSADGRTGFHHACLMGNLGVVKFLLQQGCDIHVSDNGKRTGFHMACYNGHLNVVQFLLQQGFCWNNVEQNGNTGFHDACVGGKLNQFLGQCGFQTIDDRCERIRLYFGNLNVVQFLIQEGFDMYFVNNNRMAGFHVACFSGNSNVVQFHIQEGFDMNTCANDDWNGFHAACISGSLNVIRVLLKNGFEDINGFASDDMTGLDLLVEGRNSDFFDEEFFIPCLLLLMEAGAELSETHISLEDCSLAELISIIKNRILEISFMKEILFKKWTGRIAQLITDFTMEPCKKTSLQNLSKLLDGCYKKIKTQTIVPLLTNYCLLH